MRFIFRAFWIRMIRRIFIRKSGAQPTLVRHTFDESQSTKPLEPTTIVGKAFIIDGDTLTIGRTQIRLFGIDAPELDHPFGQKAKWALVSLCKGRHIHATITEIDTHGRTVARCQLDDGRDLSVEMVALGLAIDWPKFSGGEFAKFEQPGVRKKLWLADARQKGRIHVWRNFELNKSERLNQVDKQ